MKNERKPKVWEALVPIIGMAVIIVTAMVKLKVDPHIPIVISTILAAGMALKVGCSWTDILMPLTFRFGVAMTSLWHYPTDTILLSEKTVLPCLEERSNASPLQGRQIGRASCRERV